MIDRYDVAVVGAGPGGSSAATFLARAGRRVLLLDKSDFPRDKTCGDCLSPRALGVLRDMGCLDAVVALGHATPNMRVVAPWGWSVGARLPQVHEWPDYAVVVPRLTLDDALRQCAVTAGADFRPRVTVKFVSADDQGITLTGSTPDGTPTYRARAAIIATGAATRLLLTMGVLRGPPPVMLAARAYFEGMSDLRDAVEFRFDHVPLPGYGWVFPTSATSANVGAGFVRTPTNAHRMPDTAQAAYDHFIASPPLRAVLAGAKQVGPVKGYPLRTDFVTAPTTAPCTLLVGEAAGLVNPLTGEGIDYALETGQLAARHLEAMLADDDLSATRLDAYDRDLRARYQDLFVFCHRVQARYMHPLAMNLLIAAANLRPDLKNRLVRTVLGLRQPPFEHNR